MNNIWQIPHFEVFKCQIWLCVGVDRVLQPNSQANHWPHFFTRHKFRRNSFFICIKKLMIPEGLFTSMSEPGSLCIPPKKQFYLQYAIKATFGPLSSSLMVITLLVLGATENCQNLLVQEGRKQEHEIFGKDDEQNHEQNLKIKLKCLKKSVQLIILSISC